MNKELVDSEEIISELAEWLMDNSPKVLPWIWGVDSSPLDAAITIITFLQQSGYIIIKKDQLVKEAGHIVADRFMPKEEII